MVLMQDPFHDQQKGTLISAFRKFVNKLFGKIFILLLW